MARKFVSPGVFTRETDQSYLAQGVANIGAAVIGRTGKGPAFAPVQVSDFNEFVAKFGDVDPTLQAPYAAQNYLKNSSVLNVVRVLGSRDAKTATNGWNHQVVAVSSSGGQILAEIHVLSGTVFSLSGTGSTPTFSFSGTFGAFLGKTYTGTLSFVTGTSNYIGTILNTDPTKASQYGHYLHKSYQWAHEVVANITAPYGLAALSGTSTVISGVIASGTSISNSGTSTSYDYDFTTPATPWVLSQYGDQLFWFETIADGASANLDVKVTITAIKASNNLTVTKYGTFDVVVRAFSDTDVRPVAYETFSNVTLDPKSKNYLPRVIGDKYALWDTTVRKNILNGKYPNRSKFVIVHMGTAGWDPTAIPWGHTGYNDVQLSTGAGSLIDVPYVGSNLDSKGNVAPTYWGVNFAADGITDRLKAWPHTNNATSVALAAGAAFSMAHVSGTSSAIGVSYKVYNTGSSAYLPSTGMAAVDGFTLAFQGGFDGWDLTSANPLPTGSLTNVSTVAPIALKLGVDTLSNPDEIDLNLLAIPGITDTTVTSYASLMCNTRADCMFIMDVDGASVSSVVSTVDGGGYDDNYTACYYPDLVLTDNTNQTDVQVKPSVAVLGAYAFSDRVGQVFFAPAGLNRGGLAAFGITDTKDRLTFQDRNDLYEARVNPIATFPSEGIVVFGQKTLQAKPSALDRVNVRRLLIYAKKTVASAAKYYLFEPNNAGTWTKFLNAVNPILDKIKQDQGLERFKVVMDTTTNTPDLIDRNIMSGKIFLQPTRAAEFIDLNFIVTASGVSFAE